MQGGTCGSPLGVRGAPCGSAGSVLGEQTPLPHTQVLEEFSRQVSRADWPSGSPATISYAALDGYLSKYQVWGLGFLGRRVCRG